MEGEPWYLTVRPDFHHARPLSKVPDLNSVNTVRGRSQVHSGKWVPPDPGRTLERPSLSRGQMKICGERFELLWRVGWDDK